MAFINDRPLQKVFLKNTTRMSLHERFTYLRSQSDVSAGQRQQQQREFQQQSARNRRLAMQMERRPAVMAALKIKKKSLRQRLGMTGPMGGQSNFQSVKDRLSLGQRGKSVNVRLNQASLQGQQRRGRPRGRGMGARSNSRANSLNRLGRSQSMQSLNGRQNSGGNFVRSRSRSRSRSRVQNINIPNQRFRRGGSVGPSTSGLGNRRGQGLRRGVSVRGGRFIRGGRGQFRGNGRGSGGFRGRGRGNWNNSRGSPRGRGMGRGRGRGRGRNNPVPTKEELDNQLDQYMANSRYGLDKDLDAYMKQATAGEEESWD